MSKSFRATFPLIFSLLLSAAALGQTTTPPLAQSAKPIVTATTSKERIRYVSVGEVNQTRLQIFSQEGTEVFNSDFKLGNLIDWRLTDQQGQHLATGSYLFLVTVRDFAGLLSQRYGIALVEPGQVSLQQTTLDELPSGIVAALQANKLSESISPVDRIGAAAVNPASTAFPEGSIVISDVPREKAATPKAAATGGGNISGAGTTSRVTKWTDGANGGLGDSNITEVSGNVGIGTPSPASLLHLAGANGVNAITLDTPGNQRFRFQSVPGVPNWGALTLNANYNNGWFLDDTSTNGYFFKMDTRGGNLNGPNNGLWLFRIPSGANPHTDEGPIFGVSASQAYFAGNLGIGTSSPGSALDVVGNIKVSGNAEIAGNIAAKYQDVAEWVPSSQDLTSGTVVILDPLRTNTVAASRRAYDTHIAGVVSARPGVILGEGGAGKVMVATTGRVTLKVDARRHPIKIGDLLVTSNRPGIAMKSLPIRVGGTLIHRPGTIIGKALEPLAKGEGEILVLLSLQ